VTGTQAKAIDRTYVAGLLHQARRELLPNLPHGWHGDETYKTTALTMTGGTSPVGYWPIIALPSDFLDLGDSIPSVHQDHSSNRLFYSAAQFQATARELTNNQLNEWIFMQQGKQLAYWPVPDSNLSVYLTYVALPADVTDYNSYFYFPDRGYDLLFNKCAADSKYFDDNPEAATRMDNRWRETLALAVAIQDKNTAGADTFVTRKSG